jgi:hypothetical protein
MLFVLGMVESLLLLDPKCLHWLNGCGPSCWYESRWHYDASLFGKTRLMQEAPLHCGSWHPRWARRLSLQTYVISGKVKTVLTVPSGVGSRSTNTSSRVVV